MPFGDRTGPDGLGPMTGGGYGYCNAGSMRRSFFDGPLGCGRGSGCLGLGRRRSNLSRRALYKGFAGEEVCGDSSELIRLKEDAALLKKYLNEIDLRIQRLGGDRRKEE